MRIGDLSRTRSPTVNALPERLGELPIFLDSLIREYGDYLFVVLANIGVAVIIWILTRKRRSTAQEERMAIVIMNTQPRQDTGSEPDPFDDSQSR